MHGRVMLTNKKQEIISSQLECRVPSDQSCQSFPRDRGGAEIIEAG